MGLFLCVFFWTNSKSNSQQWFLLRVSFMKVPSIQNALWIAAVGKSIFNISTKPWGYRLSQAVRIVMVIVMLSGYFKAKKERKVHNITLVYKFVKAHAQRLNCAVISNLLTNVNTWDADAKSGPTGVTTKISFEYSSISFECGSSLAARPCPSLTGLVDSIAFLCLQEYICVFCVEHGCNSYRH